MVREAVGFVVVLGQFAEIAMNVVGVAAVGFELNGHVFDAGIPHREANPVGIFFNLLGERFTCPMTGIGINAYQTWRIASLCSL